MNTPMTLEENLKLLPRYRYLENQMMELMGGWVQTIVNAEVKVAFGRQLYDDVQHSDWIKTRLPELKSRAEKNHEMVPSTAFAKFMEKIWKTEGDLFRLTVLYRVIKPHYVNALEEHYKAILPADEPTARILIDIIRQERSHIQWGERMMEKLFASSKVPFTECAKLEEKLNRELKENGGITDTKEQSDYRFEKKFPYSKKPVRDDRWTVVDDPSEYGEKSWNFDTKEGKQHLLHDLLNSEYVTVERLGQLVAQFSDIPWEMKVDLARQIWDEARHAEVIGERLHEVGGHVGMFPINFWGWEMDVNRPDPLERLALSNATFESESCKHVNNWIKTAKKTGDLASARVLEYVLADEVTHVHFGQKWIKKLTENDPERRERVLNYPVKLLEQEHPAGTKYDEVGK